MYESFETVVLRYFNVFGPRQSPFSQYAAAVPLFITKIAAGEEIDIYGDGEQSRDFTYVGNVVDATIRAGAAEGASGEIFNVAAGVAGERQSRRRDDRRRSSASRCAAASCHVAPGDLRDSWADLSKSKRVLGYAPEIALADGLRRTVDSLLG